MKKLLIAAAAAAVFISGCSSAPQVAHMQALAEYYKAEGAKATAAASVETVRLQMRGDSKKVAYAKLDSEAAERVLVAEANAEAITTVAKNGNAAAQPQNSLKPPEVPKSTLELALDYGLRFWGEVRGTARDIGPAFVAIRQSRDQRDVNIHHDDTAVSIETARQTGETGRIQSVAQIARDQVNLRPSTTINIGRDGVVDGGTQSNNNSTTSTDRHDGHQCQGGSPASGGAGGAGAPAGTGGTPAPGGSGAPSGSGQGGNC